VVEDENGQETKGKIPFLLTQILKFEMGERGKGKMGEWGLGLNGFPREAGLQPRSFFISAM